MDENGENENDLSFADFEIAGITATYRAGLGISGIFQFLDHLTAFLKYMSKRYSSGLLTIMF